MAGNNNAPYHHLFPPPIPVFMPDYICPNPFASSSIPIFDPEHDYTQPGRDFAAAANEILARHNSEAQKICAGIFEDSQSRPSVIVLRKTEQNVDASDNQNPGKNVEITPEMRKSEHLLTEEQLRQFIMNNQPQDQTVVKPKVRQKKRLKTNISNKATNYHGTSSRINSIAATSISNSGVQKLKVYKSQIQLWQFILDLLNRNHFAIQWEDREQGVFKIRNTQILATMWGELKNRPTMNYVKLSRSLRQYYKNGILIKHTTGRKVQNVFQFSPKYRNTTDPQNPTTTTDLTSTSTSEAIDLINDKITAIKIMDTDPSSRMAPKYKPMD